MEILECVYSIIYRRMLSKTKSNRSNLLKTKDVSLQHLATLNTFLDGQQSQTQYINKEIKKEVELAKKNQSLVNKTISKINDDAESLANRFQEEKQRNEKLEFLVKHIQSEILSAKTEKANNLKQNIETDKLVELTDILVEKEKELQKISEKSNSQAYELAKKIDTIRSLRSQRTIFSALFDKLERELCNLQHCYKILVIQNKIQNQQLQSKIQEFNQCQHSVNKTLEKQQTRKLDSKQKKRQPQFSININKSQALSVKQSHKTTNLLPSEQERKKAPSSNRQEQNREVREKQKSLKYENLVQRLAREKRMKVIMNELGISSVRQLPQNIDQLNKNNEELLNQNENFYNLIKKTEEKLQKLSRKKQSSQKDTHKKKQLQTKKADIGNVETTIRKTKLQLTEFKQICKILLEKINQDRGITTETQQYLNDQEEVVFIMSQIEKHMQKSYASQGLNCLNKQKRPKAESKRLTSILVSNHNEKYNLTIYEEKDLLDIAKRDMQRLNRGEMNNSVRLKTE